MHCVLEFNQSQLLKHYVEFNAQKNRKAKTKAEKNGAKDGNALYKLMNNAVYGKKNGKLKTQNRCKTCK